MTLHAAWSTLERSIFHHHRYGSSPSDLVQTVTGAPFSPPPDKSQAPTANGGDHHIAPVGIPPTAFSADESAPPSSPAAAPPVVLSEAQPFTPHAPLDERSQAAFLSLLRYAQQSEQSPHLPALLPLLLRYLLSLPYFPWHTRTAVSASSTSKDRKDMSLHHLFLSSHPAAPFSSDVLALLLRVQSSPALASPISTAVVIALRHLVLLHINAAFFLSPQCALSQPDRALLTTSSYVLQGLLFALGEQSLRHDAFAAAELFFLLLSLLSSSPSPVFHALTLRALVLLLTSFPALFNDPTLTSRVEPFIASSSQTSYKKLTSPSSSSQHCSTLILSHSLSLSLLCALHDSGLKGGALARYKEVLDVCLNSRADDDGVKVMVGCVDVCSCIMSGMVTLAAAYTDTIPVIVDTLRSILVTSRRLAQHPKEKQLRALFTTAIGSIFLSELASTAYASSLTRSFVQSSLSLVLREDDGGAGAAAYAGQLVLLLDVVAMLRNEEVSGQVVGLVLQRFSGAGRGRHLPLIVPQLTSIAMMIRNSKEVDGIVTLLINSYLNKPNSHSHSTSVSTSASLSHRVSASSTLLMPPSRGLSDISISPPQFSSVPPTFSHSNLAALHATSPPAGSAQSELSSSSRLLEDVPLALTRLAQGLHDEAKRTQMMKRIIRLFNEIAYEAIAEQVKGGAGAGGGRTSGGLGAGPQRVEACGALLPTLASLMCPEFYRQHGSDLPNPAVDSSVPASLSISSAAVPASVSSLVTPSSLPAPSPRDSMLDTSQSHPPSFPRSATSSPSSQEAIGLRVYSSRESNVKWFRRCWYILTHFDFVNPRHVSPLWTAAVRALAAHSPVLLIDNKRDYLSTELELEAERFPSPLPLPAMQRYLSSLLPSLAPSMHLFTLPQILYLSSVYHLETLRVRSGQQSGFAAIFAYIADEDVSKGGMAHAVSLIADAVFALFVEGVTGKERDSIQTREDIEKHCNFLLGKSCSRYASERAAAHSMLRRLVSRFPSVQWSSSCLTTLLTLFHRLSDSIDTETALSPSASLSLPFSISPTSPTDGQLELPESLSLRQAVRDDLARVANDWLNNAHFLVPQETLTVIQSYIQSSSQRSALSSLLQSQSASQSAAAASHAGISLTLRASKFGSDIETGLSTLVATLGRKEQYLGEVRGIFLQWQHRRRQEAQERQHAAQQANGAPSGLQTQVDAGFGPEIAAYLISSGNEMLSEYRSLTCTECHPPDPSSPSLPAVYTSLCQRVDELILHTAALLVFSTLEPTVNVPVQDLLHLTCKLPAQLFVASALSSAVFAWDWVLSASRAMELPLLIEMKAAWGYTVDRQIGLFSGKRLLREGGGAGGAAGKGYSAQLQSFVCERHPSIHCEPYAPPSQSATLSSPSASAPSSSSYDVIAPHIIWTRFLTIHFRYLQSFSRAIVNLVASMLHKAFARPELLSVSPSSFGARFRLLNLGFILIQGGALEYRDKQLLRDRVYSVAFSWFYSRPGWYDVGSVSALKEDVAVVLEVRRALQNEDKYWKATPQQQQQQQPGSSGSGSPAYSSADGGSDVRLQRLSHHRDLLLFLLSHEVDRIVVWHNPGQLTSISFTDQHLLSSRSVSASEWTQHTQTAWDIAPILAIRLSQRFPSHDAITSTLRALVKAQPEAVYDISDAVIYLVTEENVRANAAELRNLVYWSPTSLTNALLMFQPPFCHHRMVQEYAVHTLYSHPVDQVVFYLSQLLQSLRNDAFHLLYDFLRKSSHFSILLSHQLIWLCQAELGEVHKSDGPLEMTPFRTVCSSLLDSIIANFTRAERAYYQDEFSFFEQVTAISGILKPLPTKQERKAKIRQELERIPVKRGLYLPTNPRMQVREIIAKSGTPMQSAAKVPILVAFMVVEGELDEDWIRDGGREEEMRHVMPAQELQLHPQQLAAVVEEEQKVLKEEQEEQKQVEVEDKYPVALSVDDAKAATEDGLQTSRLARHGSDSSLSRHRASSNQNDEETEEESVIVISPHAPQPTSPPSFPQACIFKVGDDCRQDALALQIIQWCKTIFALHSLPLYLYPYRVLPNRTGEDGLIGGIIECVPSAQTRDEIGKATGSSLKQYFISKYGREESSGYQRAQRNFICSQAAYAITSYILQVKDRHNGNLMFDNDGHVVHIDFGFIFDISPAKNIKFEKAAFKLTQEMVELMGSSVDSPLYRWFQVLVVRGFLAVREHLHEIIAIVQPMLASSLSCFRKDSLLDLRRRFFPDVGEKEAAEAMLALIYQANGNWRTTGYDWIQAKQQGVFYYTAGGGKEEE